MHQYIGVILRQLYYVKIVLAVFVVVEAKKFCAIDPRQCHVRSSRQDE